MRNLLLGWAVATLLIVLGGVAAKADDWGNLYGYVDWASDYRFYAMSSSNRQPVAQAGLHWSMPDNFYAGIFVTGVRFKDYRKTSFETDYYGGRHFIFGGNDLNVELLYSAFPDSAGHPTYTAPGTIFRTYNFFEASSELTHTFGPVSVAQKILWSPEYGSHTGTLLGVNSTLTYAPNDWLKATAEWGHQWVENGTDVSHWDVGATATLRQQWVFDLRYYGSDVSAAHCFFMNWCKPALVGKITYQFIVL